MSPRRLFIKTFGCQMNEYDSLKIQQLLHPEYELVDNEKDAELIIVNTCSIREKPENKIYSQVGRYKKLKEKNKHLKIGVCGCVAQQERERIFKRHPFVDFVAGPQGMYSIREIVDKINKGCTHLCYAKLNSEFEIPTILGPIEKNAFKAFITIMQGCNNFCSYCIVPYVRGREISRPVEDILNEARYLVSQGVIDITLLGQNVNSYRGKRGDKTYSFAELLKEVSKIEGLKRLRFTTSHPKDITDELIACFAEIPNLCPHLHLPLQSGSDKILKRMNRKYTKEHYLNIVNKIKDIRPDISLTTDIIVGFPGETEDDFRETLEMVETIEFEQIFSFKYSKRPFTLAAKFEDDLSDEVKSDRLYKLIELQNVIGKKKYQSLVGKKVEVLVEGPSKTNKELSARTMANQIVNIKADPSLIGKLVYVTIEEANIHSLTGSLYQ